MEYTGLMRKYPVNRAITDAERERQLRQQERLDVEPAYQLSVIRMNSIYLELVDKFFEWKGLVTAVCIAAGLLFIPHETGSISRGIVRASGDVGELLAVTIEAGVFLAFMGFVAFVLLKDAFTYTHYPIRLNRKTRMVHVFRLNGTVLSVPWEDVFFCVAKLPQGFWEIQGHVLDADKATVKETFAFSMISGSKKESDLLKRYWEFVRRYMEDKDLTPIHAHARYVLPIADRRETFVHGWDRSLSMFGALPFPMLLGLLVMYVITYPGRWIAMHTSKLPAWPEEIEATCQVEPSDPYIRDARDNPEGLR